MQLSEIVGQPLATRALEQGLDSGRFIPSLIFHGPVGVGKLATALALCRALLCRSPEGKPCRDCSTCRRIDERSLLHPDVRIIFPEKVSDFEKGAPPAEGTAGIDLQERQALSISNPAWSILIDRVRQCIAFIQRRPAEGRRSILIVDQAHRMGSEAANALLKTLEEPPAHAVLMLLTASYHALLPTIRSRCRAIPFQQVPTAEIASFLIERRSLDREDAALRAGLSGGRIGAAIDLDLDAFRSRRESLLRMLEMLLSRGDPGVAVARAEEIARGAQAIEQSLEILMTLLRDLMILGAAGEAAPGLLNIDLLPRLRELAPRVNPEAPRLVDHLDATFDGIRHRGNRQMLVENFLLDLLPGAAAVASRHPS